MGAEGGIAGITEVKLAPRTASSLTSSPPERVDHLASPSPNSKVDLQDLSEQESLGYPARRPATAAIESWTVDQEICLESTAAPEHGVEVME